MLEGDSLLRELARVAALGALFAGLVGVLAAVAFALRRVMHKSAHPLAFAAHPPLPSPVRPTEPGWFWVTRHGGEPEIVYVVQRGEECIAWRWVAPQEHPVASPYFDGAHWAGPLEPPPALLAHRRRRPLE